MMRRAAIGPVLVGALTAACTCGRRSDDACDDPSLWYAPDGAGVYWGCRPPDGWTNTPPQATADTAGAPLVGAGDHAEPEVIVPDPYVDTGMFDTFATGVTAMTGATARTGDTALLDTGVVPGKADTTVPLGTGAVDTAAIDTAAIDTSAIDTVTVDTALPPADPAAVVPAAEEEPPP